MSVPANDLTIIESKRILLTGGAGFIGSHLAEALMRRGAKLSIVDNFDSYYSRSRKEKNLNEICEVGEPEVFPVDICDAAQLRQVFIRVRPEVVIHLAACVGIQPSILNPHLYEKVNVGGTINLLELMRQSKFGSSFFLPLAQFMVLPICRLLLRAMSLFGLCRLMLLPNWRPNYGPRITPNFMEFLQFAFVSFRSMAHARGRT